MSDIKLPYNWVYGVMNFKDSTDPKKALWEEIGKELQAVEKSPNGIISEVRKRLRDLDSGFLLNPNSIVATVIYCPGKSTQEVCKTIKEICSGIGEEVYRALGTDMLSLVITGNSAAEKKAAKEGFPYHVTAADPKNSEGWMFDVEEAKSPLKDLYEIRNPNTLEERKIITLEKSYLQFIINTFFEQPLQKLKLEGYLKKVFFKSDDPNEEWVRKEWNRDIRMELIVNAFAFRGIVLPTSLLETVLSQDSAEVATGMIWEHLLRQPYLFIDRGAEGATPALGAPAPRAHGGQR